MSASSAGSIPHRHGPVSILAFGDDPVSLDDVTRIGAILEFAVEKVDDIDAGMERLAAGDANVIPVLALGAGDLGRAEAALAALRSHVRRWHIRGVAIVPLALLDLAMASVDDPAIVLLCAPEPADIAAALALVTLAAGSAVHDEKERALYPELRQLSEQVLDIARALARLTGDAAGQVAGRPLLLSERSPTGDHRAGIDAAYIRAILRGRRLRDSYFSADLFADPAWDMLLDLAAARFEQRDVSVSSLCIAAAVPPTTALRWITRLIDAGLFVRTVDPEDGRRAFIALSDAAAEGMTSYLAAARRISSPVT